MKESRFYKISLLLPLALPAVVAPLLFVESHLPKWVLWAALITTLSGVIGGLPYIALVGLLFWWARWKTDNQFRRALILLPIFMLPVVAMLLGLALLVETWLRPESALPVSEAIAVWLGLVPYILGYGYFYVLLVFGTAKVLNRWGVIAA